MKKLFALLLSVLLLLFLFGCSGSEETVETANSLPTVLNQSEYVFHILCAILPSTTDRPAHIASGPVRI